MTTNEDEKAIISALMVVAFRDPYRAAEVLNAVSRREWTWTADLDDAVVVKWKENRQLRIQFSLDPASKQETAWVQVWGSLLSLALFIPMTGELVAATSRAPGSSEQAEPSKMLAANWWRETLRLSDEFLRDLGALLQPGDSALFFLLRKVNPAGAMKQLRNYGGTVLHAAITAEQDDRLKTLLGLI